MGLGSNYSVVIVGSANVDLFFKTDELPSPGETVVASAYNRSFGGKGANQAVAVAKLGGRSIMVCRVGADESGSELLENFTRSGVDTRQVIRDPGNSSGMAFITVDREGENTIVIFPGANMKLGPSDLDAAMDQIRVSGAVVAQLEIPLQTVERIAAVSREHNVPFILNPAPAPARDISGILGNVDIICPNKTEAEALTGASIANIEDAKRAAHLLMESGAGSVVLTLGSSGALLVTGDTEHHIPSPTVHVRDTTGAGDAFVGSLAYFIASGRTISDAVRYASVAAALSVTKDGTQAGLPGLIEVEELYNSFYTEG
jgi:ribokinase